jgi:hypothetical protein
MKKIKIVVLGIVLSAFSTASVLYADSNARKVFKYYKGHTHVDGQTHGAPEHSGGTNKQGCHNGKVPYHCH